MKLCVEKDLKGDPKLTRVWINGEWVLLGDLEQRLRYGRGLAAQVVAYNIAVEFEFGEDEEGTVTFAHCNIPVGNWEPIGTLPAHVVFEHSLRALKKIARYIEATLRF